MEDSTPPVPADEVPRQGLTSSYEVRTFNKGTLESRVISLAREVPYTLFVNDREVLSIATLPTHLRELFCGFLVSEGVLLHPDEIEEAFVDHDTKLVRMEVNVPEARLERLEGKGMLTSGCAGGMVFSVEAVADTAWDDVVPQELTPSSILDRMFELDTFDGLYRTTRGVHAASVADSSRTFIILEDLGRHNAVDKIVGYCFLNRIETRDKLLLTTGRITSEVLTKAARSRFPIVISRSSASSLAVTLAKQSGIDIVTYVRAGKFNHFSHGAVTFRELSREGRPEL